LAERTEQTTETSQISAPLRKALKDGAQGRSGRGETGAARNYTN